MEKRKIIVGVTGASGAIYAKVLLDQLLILSEQIEQVGIVMSDNAETVWEYELENDDYKNYPFTFYKKDNFFAPFASGSGQYDTLVIAPCSMGTLGRIASGVSNDLLTRAADVILKERRKLILLVRETPFNAIHIHNMKLVNDAGGVICPANPSFYSKPQTINDVALTVIHRVIDLMGFTQKAYRWGEKL